MFPANFFVYKQPDKYYGNYPYYNNGFAELEEEEEEEDLFTKLPDEIILKVFQWLPVKVIGECATVCRKFSTLVRHESLWENVDVLGKYLSPESTTEIFQRRPEFLRMARADIPAPLDLPHDFQSSQLVFLDLSMALIAPDVLARILASCTSLVKCSFENLVVSTAALMALERCGKTLDTLNFALCTIMDAGAFANLLRSCSNTLTALNIGFVQNAWTGEALTGVIKSLPRTILNLNISGYRTLMTDSDVEYLVERVPLVTDLDLSDCQLLTDNSVYVITQRLNNVQHLAISRCYGIAASVLPILEYSTTLRHLEIFSLYRESTLSQLMIDIPAVIINQCPFSSVARPTIANHRTTIWGHRVRYFP